MRNNHIYIPKENSIVNEDNYDQVNTSTSDPDTGSVSAESDLAESPAGQTIRSSYQSPIFGDQNPLEPCPVNGCPLNPQSGVITILIFKGVELETFPSVSLFEGDTFKIP